MFFSTLYIRQVRDANKSYIYKKNTNKIIFFISRKTNTNILGPNFLDAQASLAPTHVSP